MAECRDSSLVFAGGGEGKFEGGEIWIDGGKHEEDRSVRVKERISNVSRTYSRLCWRKRQRFVIVSPWRTLVHLAVSVNMITGIKHPQPRHPRELQLTAQRHGVIS